jgi:hypothetical protein
LDDTERLPCLSADCGAFGVIEALTSTLLPLAAKIAREFANIRGLPHPEIEIAAQEAPA